MAKLIMLRGLPASGKSTWAKEQVEKSEGKTKRVNKDDLRAMIDSGKWSKKREKNILHVRDAMISIWLFEDYDVICDDTNLAQKHKQRLEELAYHRNAEFEIKDFDVPLFECIKRDSLREKSVGSEVITKMYYQFLFDKTNWTKPLKEIAPNVIIVDIDGTLSIRQNRSPFDASKYGEDLFNYNLWYLIKNQNIIFLSGREGTEEARKNTIDWLKKYTKIKSDDFYMSRLIMRKEGDNRKDSIIKAEIYDNEIEPYYNVIGVYDDRSQVVEMWRSKGLFCMQVNYGDF